MFFPYSCFQEYFLFFFLVSWDLHATSRLGTTTKMHGVRSYDVNEHKKDFVLHTSQVRLPDFQPINIVHPSHCHHKLKHETSCTQQRQSVEAWLAWCSFQHNTAGLLTNFPLLKLMGSLSCQHWLMALINTDKIGSHQLSAEMASSRSPLRVASDWDAGMEGRMGLVRSLGSSLSLSEPSKVA